MNNQRETVGAMEWLVKKSHYVKKRACHVLVLCDSGWFAAKMIAEANSMILRFESRRYPVALQDAQYCINREKHRDPDARRYSCDEWQRLTRAFAIQGRKSALPPAIIHNTSIAFRAEKRLANRVTAFRRLPQTKHIAGISSA